MLELIKSNYYHLGGDNSYQKYIITYNNVYKYYVIIMKELINVDDYYKAKRLKNSIPTPPNICYNSCDGRW